MPTSQCIVFNVGPEFSLLGPWNNEILAPVSTKNGTEVSGLVLHHNFVIADQITAEAILDMDFLEAKYGYDFIPLQLHFSIKQQINIRLHG